MKRFGLFIALTLSLGAASCERETKVDLGGAEWQVSAIDGAAVAGRAPTLTFGPDGRMSGFGGCNRIMGSYTQDGASLGFGPVAGTKMMCPDDEMAVEQAFLAALARVDAVAAAAGGGLDLRSAGRVVIAATR